MLNTASNVLVTGANGFIGEVLCRHLQASGCNVYTLSRSAFPAADKHWHVDLATDELPTSLLSNIDTIFHLAGKAHALSEHHQDDQVYRNINTLGTHKLLTAAQQAGVKRFVYFSSVKAVGDSIVQPMDETVSLTADTPYGLSKFEAEQLVLSGGFVPHPVVIRPCMVYGNTAKGNLPRMIKSIKRGFFPPLPELHNRRSMVHVEDVVAAAILAAESPAAAGQIYIISGEQSYSSRELYDLIRSALGQPPATWKIPLWFLISAAKLGDTIGNILKRRFFLDSDTLRKLTASACYSSAKIHSQLGFRPQHTLQQSLPDIIRYLNLI